MSKPKIINFELIEDLESEPYQILAEMREFHPDVQDAKIALAWRKNFAMDNDGHLVLGKCVKATDLQREFSDYDFVILLNQEVWHDPEFTDDKKRALVDHELCHTAPALDQDGGARWDERGRRVWRVRKHDIEEFYAIVRRHGCYKRDLEIFAEELSKKRRTPLLNDADGVGEAILERICDEALVKEHFGDSAYVTRGANGVPTINVPMGE